MKNEGRVHCTLYIGILYFVSQSYSNSLFLFFPHFTLSSSYGNTRGCTEFKLRMIHIIMYNVQCTKDRQSQRQRQKNGGYRRNLKHYIMFHTKQRDMCIKYKYLICSDEDVMSSYFILYLSLPFPFSYFLLCLFSLIQSCDVYYISISSSIPLPCTL